CLVIGWATKYFDLLKNYNKLDYFFDGRNTIDLHKINNKLDKMIQCYKYEKEKIIERMNIINNKENIFNEVFEHMKKTN
ncbi:MAG TPA: hypothetical protein PKX05_01930, partial [bacterium]|nr:hypothetical protein [bacterium]